MAKKDIVKHPVESTNLEWVAYDKDEKQLFIQFRSGGLYRYFDVPEDIYEKLLKAGSKGRFHNVFIKYNYKYEKMN